MTTLLFALILLPAVTLLYAWALYPMLLSAMSALARRRRAPPRAAVPDGHDAAPPLAVLISAFNEESVIAARIRNLLDADYPADRLTALIGTDGCTDRTAALAREAAAQSPRISIIEFANNRGKVSVLRDLVARVSASGTAPLLVFSDANTAFRPDALRLLARHFDDPLVGGVCGRLIFKGARSGEEHAYWNLENMLKARESDLDSCLGANGSIYAIRPECFWQDIPANVIVDDFVIGMKVREAGLRLRYDPEAVAEEDIPDIRDEWRRRVRIGSGDYQAALLCRGCFHPRFGLFAWCFWSHKIMRWFTPHLLLLMLASAIALSIAAAFLPVPPFVMLAAHAVCLGAALLLGAALAGRLSRRRAEAGWLRLCRGAGHFATMQAALMAGFLRFCRGNLSGAWGRTPRSAA